MKLQLSKEWFEQRIGHDKDFDVSVGGSVVRRRSLDGGQGNEQERASNNEFAESLAFGTLIQLLRRDRRLTAEQLAAAARVDAAEIVKIEFDPKYLPHPRSMHQLESFFGLPDGALVKLSNVTMAPDAQLREAAYRFAAIASKTAELSREERVALTEFVTFLGTQTD